MIGHSENERDPKQADLVTEHSAEQGLQINFQPFNFLSVSQIKLKSRITKINEYYRLRNFIKSMKYLFLQQQHKTQCFWAGMSS